MLEEPPYHKFDLNFRISGIEVRVSILFWILLCVGGIFSRPNELLLIFIWMLVVLVSIVVHELGHVLAFRRYGIPSRIVLYHFGGLAISDDFSMRRKPLSRRQRVIVALAGPAAGFLFAAIVILAVYLLGGSTRWSGFFPDVYLRGSPRWANETIRLVLWVNVAWGLVNLIPLYPLDGGQVSREVFMQLNPQSGMRQSLRLSVVIGAVMMYISLGHVDKLLTQSLAATI